MTPAYSLVSGDRVGSKSPTNGPPVWVLPQYESEGTVNWGHGRPQDSQSLHLEAVRPFGSRVVTDSGRPLVPPGGYLPSTLLFEGRGDRD